MSVLLELKDSERYFLELMHEHSDVGMVANLMDIPKWKVRTLAQKHSEALIEMAQAELAIMGGKAVRVVSDTLSTVNDTQASSLMLKAAESVLDRMGAGKKNAIEGITKVISPVILMPAKNVAQVPTITVFVEED